MSPAEWPARDREIPVRGAPSSLAIRKHPLHPVIVGFPTTLLTGALLTDLLFWRTGAAQWAEFSFWLILAGWLSGLLSVFTGLVDFLTIERARAHKDGWIHFLLMDLAIFLSTLNLFGRFDDRQEPVLFGGLGLSAAVFVALLVGGYYGGRLVYRYLIGVYGLE